MHSQETKQPYIRSARKNRTRKKKSAVEEDPSKIPQKNKKKKRKEKKRALRIAEITESLKREKPKHQP